MSIHERGKFVSVKENCHRAVKALRVKHLASSVASLVACLLLCAANTFAQQAPSAYLTPYGPPISIEAAKKAAAAALAEARKNHWLMAVAVVDPDGEFVYYEKMDNVQLGHQSVN